MSTKTIITNNNVLRSNISHRVNRPCTNELLFVAFCLENQNEFEKLRDYPFVTEYEYDLELDTKDASKGDLILTNDNSCFLIVEVKFLCEAKGKTAKTRKNKQRNKVKEQAQRYLKKFQDKHPDAKAESYALTNEILNNNEELKTKFNAFRTKRKENWKKRERKLYFVKVNGRL